jgi:hypothetical protein
MMFHVFVSCQGFREKRFMHFSSLSCVLPYCPTCCIVVSVILIITEEHCKWWGSLSSLFSACFYYWNEYIYTFFLFSWFFGQHARKNPLVILNLFSAVLISVSLATYCFLIVIQPFFIHLKVTDIFLQFIFCTRRTPTSYFDSSPYNYYFN